MDALASLAYFSPELILAGASLLVIFLDFLNIEKRKLGLLSLFLIVGSGVSLVLPYETVGLFSNFYILDSFSFVFQMIALTVIALATMASIQSDVIPEKQKGEFFALLLMFGFLLMVMGSATNLLMIFLAIESVSIVSYILTGFQKFNKRASEAALKYLLFGAVSSAIMLFGMSLLFGLTGSLELNVIAQILGNAVSQHINDGATLALVLMLVGFGFKISAAPFHTWAPDVYQGAPTPVAALLTVGPKSFGFLVLMRVLIIAFPQFYAHWSPILVLLSILTMTIGNVIAVSQENMKRLLAYSSVAQAGYILMGLAVANETGIEAIFVYLIAYIFTNMGAFLAVSIIEQSEKHNKLDTYNGLAKRSPFLALSLTIFMLSLAGIPPLAGFLGKWYVFASAIEGGFVALAVVAAINSAVAAFYYFRVIRAMYLVPNENTSAIPKAGFTLLAVIIALLGTIAIGLFPAPLLAFIQDAIAAFRII